MKSPLNSRSGIPSGGHGEQVRPRRLGEVEPGRRDQRQALAAARGRRSRDRPRSSRPARTPRGGRARARALEEVAIVEHHVVEAVRATPGTRCPRSPGARERRSRRTARGARRTAATSAFHLRRAGRATALPIRCAGTRPRGRRPGSSLARCTKGMKVEPLPSSPPSLLRSSSRKPLSGTVHRRRSVSASMCSTPVPSLFGGRSA